MVEKSRSWNLKLNASKCVAIRFGIGSSVEALDGTYFVEGNSLSFVSSYRDLGVTVDTSLRFHQHISGVVDRAGR